MNLIIPSFNNRSSKSFEKKVYELGRSLSNSGRSDIKVNSFKSEHEFHLKYVGWNDTIKDFENIDDFKKFPSIQIEFDGKLENDDWRLIAVVRNSFNQDIDETGNIKIRKNVVRSIYHKFPKECEHYLNEKLICEHCHKLRDRNNLFLFQSLRDHEFTNDKGVTETIKAGEYRMVGSSCFEVYTGLAQAIAMKLLALIEDENRLGKMVITPNNVEPGAFQDVNLLPNANDIIYAIATEDSISKDGIKTYVAVKSHTMVFTEEDLNNGSLTKYKDLILKYDNLIKPVNEPLFNALRDYYTNEENGKKLLANKSSFDNMVGYYKNSLGRYSSEKAFMSNIANAALDRTIIFNMNSIPNLYKFFLNPPEPRDYTAEERVIQIWKENGFYPNNLSWSIKTDLNVGDIVTVSKDEIVNELSKITQVGYPKSTSNFSIVRKDATVINFSDCEYLLNKNIIAGIDNINTITGEITLAEQRHDNGYYYKATIKSVNGIENKISPKYEVGDNVDIKIDSISASSYGWYNIKDEFGNTFCTKQPKPTNADSLRANIQSYNSTYKNHLITNVQYYNSNELPAPAISPDDMDSILTKTDGPFLGEVGDEVYFKVKAFNTVRRNGRFGEYYIYNVICEDPIQHMVSWFGKSPDLIKEGDIVKAKVKNQNNWQGELSTFVEKPTVV